VGRSSFPATEFPLESTAFKGRTVGVQVRYLESHCPAQTSPIAETVTRGSDDVNLIVGWGDTAFGVLFWFEISAIAETEDQSPEFKVNWSGVTATVYSS
jgi:hypothetical protein